jgi:hypothetical protein
LGRLNGGGSSSKFFQNASIVANVISQIILELIINNSISVYSSDFYNNSIFNISTSWNKYWCTFSDSSNMFEAIQSNNSNNHIVNSTITGRVDY